MCRNSSKDIENNYEKAERYRIHVCWIANVFIPVAYNPQPITSHNPSPAELLMNRKLNNELTLLNQMLIVPE